MLLSPGGGLLLGAACLWVMNIVYKDLKETNKRNNTMKKIA